MKGSVRISKEEMEKQQFYMSQIRKIHAGKVLYAAVQTFGCQQNEADSERLCGMMCEMGYTITEDIEKADLIVINTCAVREHAELKALSITGNFKHYKQKKPSLLVGICGCMVSQEHRKNKVLHSYPYVDFSFGTTMLYRFPEILYRTITEQKRIFQIQESEGNIAEGIPVCRKSSFQAWVSIMYGCNNFCTYCIVPYVRGRERSRLPADILEEVKGLVASGYREITLLGQNVNSYGKDLDTDYDFSDLLREIDSIDGDYVLRFMTSHPKDASQKLFDTISASCHIARHFHLPLQSGSDRILKQMNRHYTKSDFLSKAAALRNAVPEMALTTDIIVGFPGETEEDFQETLDVLRTVAFDNIYAFLYSPRQGTPAAQMTEQIDESVKTQRFSRLMEVQNEICHTLSDRYLGKELRVLVEGHSKNNPEKLTGRTSDNRVVHFEADDSYIGTFQTLEITQAHSFALYGELISKNNI